MDPDEEADHRHSSLQLRTRTANNRTMTTAPARRPSTLTLSRKNHCPRSGRFSTCTSFLAGGAVAAVGLATTHYHFPMVLGPPFDDGEVRLRPGIDYTVREAEISLPWVRPDHLFPPLLQDENENHEQHLQTADFYEEMSAEESLQVAATTKQVQDDAQPMLDLPTPSTSTAATTFDATSTEDDLQSSTSSGTSTSSNTNTPKPPRRVARPSSVILMALVQAAFIICFISRIISMLRKWNANRARRAASRRIATASSPVDIRQFRPQHVADALKKLEEEDKRQHDPVPQGREVEVVQLKQESHVHDDHDVETDGVGGLHEDLLQHVQLEDDTSSSHDDDELLSRSDLVSDSDEEETCRPVERNACSSTTSTSTSRNYSCAPSSTTSSSTSMNKAMKMKLRLPQAWHAQTRWRDGKLVPRLLDDADSVSTTASCSRGPSPASQSSSYSDLGAEVEEERTSLSSSTEVLVGGREGGRSRVYLLTTA
ncbi:unnamed protein product [Amoebophrya sp. A25]|nr:unnamed protein product [Amoebophrya sp. A25]|eukprot:GSA25T00004688001.1